jgi:hypothetical protein
VLRRRRSNLLSGIGRDAGDVYAHLRGYLDDTARGRCVVSRPALSAVS